jgi:hypothetical protein
LIYGIRQFFAAASGHLLKKIPWNNNVLKNARILQPDRKKESWTTEAVKSLAKKMPVSLDRDRLVDEWKMYQDEEISEEPQRVDAYWNAIGNVKTATNEMKYPNLMPFVKSLLVLAHGNADVERGFSDSGKSVTSQRTSLSEESTNGLRSTCDALKAYGNKAHAVPINKDFLQKARSTHMSYVKRLEEERKKLEEAKEKLRGEGRKRKKS